jgi:hypothetical protein
MRTQSMQIYLQPDILRKSYAVPEVMQNRIETGVSFAALLISLCG